MSPPVTFSEFFSFYDLENLKHHFERHGYCSILSLTLVTKHDLEEMGIFDEDDQQDFIDAITDYDTMTYQCNKDTGMSCHLIDTPIIEFLSSLHSPLSPESKADYNEPDKCTAARRKLIFTNDFCNRSESGKKRKPDGQNNIGYHESSACEKFRISLFPTTSDMKILGDDVDQDETDRAIDLLIQQMKDIEKNNLSMLKDAMNKSNTNTQNMLTILNSFENRLKKLESTVEPVYNETEMLRRRQENIDKTLFTLDNVLGYFHVAKEVEANIIEGPSVGGLDKYLGHMDRLLEAHNYFNTHNPASLDLTDVMRVYDEGKDILQREFRTMLSRHGRPVPPVMILDLIGSDEELQHDEPDVLEHLPEKVVSDLGEIAKWLITKGNTTEFLKDYQKLRADMLHRSLQGLKEHMKSSSCSSASSGLFPGQQSPAPIGKFRGTKDTPVRKSMKKIAHNFKKKASSALLQSPFDPGHKRQGSYTDSLKDEIFDVEEDILITELSALLKLMQSEIQLMSGIIPEKHHRTVFDGIVQPGLDTVVTEGELLATNAKKNIGRHEFTAVLSIFPVVKHLRTIKPEFDFTLEGCQVPTRAKLASLLSVLGSTGAKALEEFIDSIKNDPERASMPRDGTVHELTNHAIIFIEPLQDYADTAGAMLLMHGEQAAPSDAVDIKKCKLKLADYITKVLSALGLNLNNKCETYNDPTLRHVFMLNNLNYIQKSLKRSGLIELIHSWNKDVCQYYDDQILEQKRFYSQSWSKVLHYILDVNEPMSIQRTQGTEPVKLKEKQKQNIKDKFTGFNKELEEITRIQKGYAIPDPELRDGLKKDNIDYIVPTYKIFLEKYKKLNFTKNQDKYIKYTAENVEHMINNLFDTSA